MSHEKTDFPNCPGLDKLAGHRLHGTDAPPDRAATADQIDDGLANRLFQGMRFDPAHDTMHLHQRDHSPTLKAWMQHDPCGYVDALNVYAAPIDEPVNPINPLGSRAL